MTEQREHWAQSTADPVPGAPAGVRPISLEALGHLGVDGDGNLYWLDTKVLTAKKEFKLSWFQGTLATITAVSALAAAIAACISAYSDWNNLNHGVTQASSARVQLKEEAK